MTGVLLDTNAALWLVQDSGQLGPITRELIASQPVWVSSASVWEVSIKQRLDKLTLSRDFISGLADASARELPITWAHSTDVRDVELAHRDPFDRMLVAQAKSADLTLVTSDRQILGARLPFVHNARD